MPVLAQSTESPLFTEGAAGGRVTPVTAAGDAPAAPPRWPGAPPAPSAGGPQGVSLVSPAHSPGPSWEWGLGIWWEAGEAVLWLQPPAVGCGAQGPAEARSGRSAEEIAAEGDCRARGDMRRWGRANRLTHLGTLTNRDVVTSWSEMERRKERFLERMHEAGWDCPIALVAEPHPGGHGFHLHFGAPRFIPIERLRAWWPYGIVDIRGRAARRAIARRRGGIPGYLSKYIGKGVGEGDRYGCEARPAGAKRWWHTRGAEPTRTTHHFDDLAAAVRWLHRVYGEPDEVMPIGRDDVYRPEGYWLHFPEACLRAPP